MQQVMYQDAPVIVLAHPFKLGAYRTDKWQGWERANYGTGPAFAGQINPWAYYTMQPKAATATGGGTSSSWIVAIVVAAIVAAVAAYFVVWRRRRAHAEEEQGPAR